METKNLKELAEELERQKNSRYDVVVPSDKLIVLKDGNTIKIDVPLPEGEMKRHGLTNWAHAQIAEKTQIPKRYYDRMKDEGQLDLLANNVNTWLPSKDKRLVRVLDGNVRALLSDRYRIIDNYDVLFATLEEFQKIQEKTGINIEIKRADLTDQHLYIKATSPDLTDEVIKTEDKTEPVHGGIIITNSEVGAGAFNVKPFMNVLVCQNGLIGEHVFKKVHLGQERGIGLINWSDDTLSKQDDALWAQIRDMIHGTFNPEVFHKWVDKLNGVASIEIEKPSLAIDNIIKKFELGKNKKDALLNQFAKETNTQWGLAMAVTRIAQDEENYEDQIKMEQVGTEIMNTPKEVLVKE